VRAGLIPGREPSGELTVVDSQADARVVTSSISLDEASPLLSGHFPGEPIFPGVAQLGWVLLAAEKLERRTVRLSALRDFRLRQVVGPGDVIDVIVTRATTPGEIRFEIRKGAKVASSGVLVLGSTPPHG